MVSKIEIKLNQPDDFLKIRETLTRIGIANNKTSTLVQSCHILQKRGRYYIVHFKELLALDGLCVTFSTDDIERRNDIAFLLENWGLCTIVDKESHSFSGQNFFRVLKSSESKNWTLVRKYEFRKTR